MAAPRVDWNAIKEHIQVSPYDEAEPVLVIIPHAGRHLLLALAERLEWRATYSGFGYDYEDWDYLQSIVAETQSGLTIMEQVNLILAMLEEIRDAIQALTPGEIDLEPVVDVIAPIAPELGALGAILEVLGGD